MAATQKLVRSITGTIYVPEVGITNLTKQIEGQVGSGDYFKVFGLTVIQQDFSRVEESVTYNTPLRFGVINTFDKTMVNIEINK